MSMILIAQVESIGLLMMIVPLGVFVYLLVLATRFVRAVERIAEKLDRT